MSIDHQVFLMPHMAVNECVVENEDGSYTIFINENLFDEKRMKVYQHALAHIQNFDFEKYDVQDIEAHAHGKY